MYYGCNKEIEDHRDYKVCSKVKSTNVYAKSYKLDITNIKDQGIVNSCVAHALASFLEQQNINLNKKFSTGFIYGYRPFGYSQSEGMYPRQAIKTLKDIGDVENKYFNHNKEMMEIKNLVDNKLDELKPLAEVNKIISYARISAISEIKDCIIKDTPVPISIPVYDDIELDENNIIQMTGKPISGYHMILIYGWNEQGFLIQNSWGKYWGNKGTAILPYEYPIDSAWAIETNKNNIETKKPILYRILDKLKAILLYLKIIFLSKGEKDLDG